MAPHAFRIGIVDNISHPLLKGEVQGLGGFVVDTMLTTDGEEEGAQTTYFRHLVFHDETTRRVNTWFLSRTVSEEQHRKVIALFCTIGKHADMLFQEVDNLNGRSLTVFLNIVENTLLAKKFSAAVVGEVHGFRQSVSIEKQRTSWREVHLLLIVVISILNTNWKVCLHFQKTAFPLCCNHHRGIMRCITIGEVVRLHVEHTR